MYIKRISIPIVSFLIMSCNTTSIFAMKEFDAKKATQLLAEYKYGDLQNIFNTNFPAKTYKSIDKTKASHKWLEKAINETQDPYLSFEHTHRVIYEALETKNYDCIIKEFGPIIFNIIHIIAEYKAYKALFSTSPVHFLGIHKNPINIWLTCYKERFNPTFFGPFLAKIDVEKIKFNVVQKVFEEYYNENLGNKIKNEKNFFRFIQTWDRLPITSLFVGKRDNSYRPHLFNIDILDEKNTDGMSASIMPNENGKGEFSIKNSLILTTFNEDKKKGIFNRVMTETFKQCKEYIMNAKDWSELWNMHEVLKVNVTLKDANEEKKLEL